MIAMSNRVNTIAKANTMLVMGCRIRAALENRPTRWSELNHGAK